MYLPFDNTEDLGSRLANVREFSFSKLLPGLQDESFSKPIPSISSSDAEDDPSNVSKNLSRSSDSFSDIVTFDCDVIVTSFSTVASSVTSNVLHVAPCCCCCCC